VECNNHPELVCKLTLEFLVAIGISYVTGFGYTGMVVLLLADIMRYTIDWKKRALYILAVSAFSLLINGNVLQKWIHVIPLDIVWSYYRADHLSRFLGILNILDLINIYVFIFYMVILALSQMSEKERILVLNNELKEANIKLEEYASESARMAETRERNRLAREIHDTLGHSLTGIITGIEACIMLMDIAPEATKEQLRAIAEVARTGIIDVRHSVKALHADALESMDIEDALHKLVDSTTRSTGVEISMNITTDLSHFNQDEGDVIYRVVQESITNAIRHGKATKINISIDRIDGELHIIISDNGVGCSDVKSGFGLHHMKERLDMLGGHLEYTGNLGFTIHAVIPIRWGNEN
jgi:signal transduction histidine kinase